MYDVPTTRYPLITPYIYSQETEQERTESIQLVNSKPREHVVTGPKRVNDREVQEVRLRKLPLT